ncbi:unnamed protein product, partial [Musa acuminata subsp. burmannicoides]
AERSLELLDLPGDAQQQVHLLFSHVLQRTDQPGDGRHQEQRPSLIRVGVE